jgi:hypothetical protein
MIIARDIPVLHVVEFSVPRDLNESVEANMVGKHFRLNIDLFSLELPNRVPVLLPHGTVVSVTKEPNENDHRMVDVLCQGRTLAMYALDLQLQATEVKE